MTEFRHTPVLLNACMEYLAIKPAGVYVDATLGGGGHSSAILQRLGENGRLIGIDRDSDALNATAARIHDARFCAVKGNFHDIRAILDALAVARVDGVLADLGVSSYQLDEKARGFSYQEDAPLDMRMDRAQNLCAADIVNTYSEDELTRVLRDWGEEAWARQIARVLVDRRARAPITTTLRLVECIDCAIPKRVRAKDGAHPARRTFQALRIEVNNELAPLETALTDMAEALNPGGRLCVIAFHSLEDRIVKNTFRRLADPCTCPKNMPVCVCGKKPVVRLVTRKPITADEEELAANPRARSATLRVAEKLEAMP